jgi:hypothetical protein
MRKARRGSEGPGSLEVEKDTIGLEVVGEFLVLDAFAQWAEHPDHGIGVTTAQPMTGGFRGERDEVEPFPRSREPADPKGLVRGASVPKGLERFHRVDALAGRAGTRARRRGRRKVRVEQAEQEHAG